MVTAAILIGAIIIAITQALKFLSAKISGIITMIVAVLVGIVIAALSSNPKFGIPSITIAQGVLVALGALGVHTTASAVNTGPKV